MTESCKSVVQLSRMAAKVKQAGKMKKRAMRATSNVFAMFDQAQIQEFKEAFNMIDQNHDGFIDKEDLHDMLASLGSELVLWLCIVVNMSPFTSVNFHAYRVHSVLEKSLKMLEFCL